MSLAVKIRSAGRSVATAPLAPFKEASLRRVSPAKQPWKHAMAVNGRAIEQNFRLMLEIVGHELKYTL
jgi:hypothetical protein